MIARLLISPSLENIKKEIQQILASLTLGKVDNHPDVLYFSKDAKLGIEQARKIKEHFSLKPYSAKGRMVALEDASNLTADAQNALLKILEELPEDALFIMGTSSKSKLLPTVLSRCQIIQLESVSQLVSESDTSKHTYNDIEKLLDSTIEQRFEYIEKLKDREQFFNFLVDYFHKNLASFILGTNSFLKELLQAEEWAKQNGNIRAILEYLMLKIPKKESRI